MNSEIEIIKRGKNVLIKTPEGEYHFSHDDFERLGKAEAVKYAQKEIEKKNNSYYHQKDIDFKRARDLGFCEEGIEDFCERLNLDVEKTYKIHELKEALTREVFDEYKTECMKIFGKSVIDKFGGIYKYTEENGDYYLLKYFMPDNSLHELGCKFAERVLPNFEEKYPGDDRPRKATEAKRKWIKREISDDELSAAGFAARYAAASAAGSAAYYATYYAANSAARYAAASAAHSAAERAAQKQLVLEELERLGYKND